ERLAGLRSAAEAAEQLATVETGKGRFDSAEQVLDGATRQLHEVADLHDLRVRLEARRGRLHRLVMFYRLLEAAERWAFREYDEQAILSCERALEHLGIRKQADAWWNGLPAEDLQADQHKQLQKDAHRTLLLLAALHAKRGLMNPEALQTALSFLA